MPTRRTWLQGAAAACAALVLPAAAAPPMRVIPATQEPLPLLGLGTWRGFDVEPGSPEEAECAATLDAFVAGGGRVVDTSPMYGRSSATLGRLAAARNVADRFFYSTKLYTRGSAAGRAQLDGEHRYLHRDVLDLVFVHNLTDLANQLTVLRDAQQRGAVTSIGISHYHAGAHAELERVARIERPAVVQVNYSLLEPEAGARLLPACAALGIAVFVNRPFAEGALFDRLRGRAVPDWAVEAGMTTWAQVALRWIVSDPHVTVVLSGTRNPRHVADNLAAVAGPLPDAAMRAKMLAAVRAAP